MFKQHTVQDIRQYFVDALQRRDFIEDRTGVKTLQLIGASFIADEPTIFGAPNKEYIDAEIKWYNSCSTNIKDIYGDERQPPIAWINTANKHGEINSNYGYLIHSPKYFNQFRNVLHELRANPKTRRATMVYTRPSIWVEYNENGKNDFICTNAVTYYIDDDKQLNAVVQMRSNDCWAGYRNDYAWQAYVLDMLCEAYNKDMQFSKFIDPTSIIKPGKIIWQVQNLHVYDQNFYLIDAFAKGIKNITKNEYRVMFPESEWA